MRAARTFAMLLAAAAASAAVSAQGLPAGQGLAAQLRWLQLSLVNGRLALLSEQISLTETHARLGDRQERLRIGIADDLPAIDYLLTGKDLQLQIALSHRDWVEIRRRSLGGGPTAALEFVQHTGDDLRLEITVDGHTERYSAPTLWHLWLAEPEVCRKNLEPLLRLMRPQWKPDADAREIEALLLASGSQSAPQSAQWDQWVAQLGDEQYARREAADRNLRQAGQSALAYLSRLDPATLDAEQRFRIRRILLRLEGEVEEDTPERVVTWLRGDPRAWLALAERPEAATREIAARQLQALLPGATFDPTADEATRRDQLAKLAEKLGE